MTKKREASDIKDVTIKTFHHRLEDVIKELGVSKKEFAKAGGVTPQALSGYLAGKRRPDYETVAKWVREYNLNANYLLIYRGTIFRSAADNRHPMDISEAETAGTAQSPTTPLGPVTMAVASMEQAHLAMDPDATETEVMEAILRAMNNRLQKIAPKYGSRLTARETSFHESPAQYPGGSAEDDQMVSLQGDACGIDQDPPTPREQFLVPGRDRKLQAQDTKSNK
jgi:transcriptional regulator with XRE-family HTH domain